MIDFGKTLRTAREEKGYTIGQVAEATRLMPSMIEDLEKENFSHIAAPIYGRGFVKLYCEAVGLDPKPLVAEFMDIFNGKREVAIKERPADNPAEAPIPVPEASTLPETEEPEPAKPITPMSASPKSDMPPKPASDLFELMSDPVAPPTPPPAKRSFATSEDPRPLPESQIPQAPKMPRLSRYSDPAEPALSDHRSDKDMPSFSLSLSPIVWRIGILVIGAIVVLGLLVVGIKALYRATTDSRVPAANAETTVKAEAPVQPTQPAVREPTSATPQAEAPAAKVKRVPQKIPSLYID